MSFASGPLLLFLTSFVLLLTQGGCGLITAPAGAVTLHVSGTVRERDSGEPLPGATVRLVVQGLSGWMVLASARTDAEGGYGITHRLKRVAREPELGDSCAVWHDDVASDVGLMVSRTPTGLALDGADGLDGVPRLRCVAEPQTLDFRLR